ncbi:hypothetical protein Pcinc_033816 [Petrolisthes cinctipes]|uniref:Uncharacterized protein n=1 Tax=Petrolisthes cinctipes TaxID=88211 RepID=A0AAE1ERF2_PETCI|nr:hypothetical protein Pcinc_033816 [Petrolisthes cinctipes]
MSTAPPGPHHQPHPHMTNGELNNVCGLVTKVICEDGLRVPPHHKTTSHRNHPIPHNFVNDEVSQSYYTHYPYYQVRPFVVVVEVPQGVWPSSPELLRKVMA